MLLTWQWWEAGASLRGECSALGDTLFADMATVREDGLLVLGATPLSSMPVVLEAYGVLCKVC